MRGKKLFYEKLLKKKKKKLWKKYEKCHYFFKFWKKYQYIKSMNKS